MTNLVILNAGLLLAEKVVTVSIARTTAYKDMTIDINNISTLVIGKRNNHSGFFPLRTSVK